MSCISCRGCKRWMCAFLCTGWVGGGVSVEQWLVGGMCAVPQHVIKLTGLQLRQCSALHPGCRRLPLCAGWSWLPLGMMRGPRVL
jgi:hypothetical protein